MSTDKVQEALERFKQAQDFYNEQRLAAREDLKFVAGEQWADSPNPDDEMRLTVNLLNPFLRQITAEARSANPSIRVIPVAAGADEDLAELCGGLIRHIEQASEADAVYQKALWYAAASGEGYFGLDTDYCSDLSFDQDLKIVGFPNPEKVFLDPRHEALDGCDSEWAFVIEDISHAAYGRQFPDSKISESIATKNFALVSLPGDWMNKDTVRVAKYWCKEYEMKKIYLVLDPLTGNQVTQDTAPTEDQVLLNSRTAQKVTVKCYLMNGCEILETLAWPGKYIPIVKVTGDSFYVAGERQQFGAIRFAKDPQRQYNYFTSRQTEMIDLAPKNSFVGATGQFANNPEKWANANRTNFGFLDYTPQALNGQPLPPPTRVSGLDLNGFNGVTSSRAQALEDLKLTFGLHDAALGRMQQEASGVALANRVEQSSRSTYQYFDNLLLALKCLGRQIVDLLPYFYDTERTVRIVKPTEEERMVKINDPKKAGRYDIALLSGNYDVVVTTGPAYASKRQEAYEALSNIAGTNPAAGAVIGDLIISQIDSPVARLAASRVKATIPKEILAATGDDNGEDLAPKELLQKAQMELAQIQMQLKQKDMENQELQVQVKVAEDKSALELTKMDVEGAHKTAQLRLDERMAELEYQLKVKEIELKERQLELTEQKMKIEGLRTAHEMNESTREEMAEHQGRAHNEASEYRSNVDIPDMDSDTNLGGALE